MGIQFPEHYGGAGMSAVDYCICIEELARVDPSVSLSVAAHNGLGAAHISMFASEEQKQKYLVPLAKGEKLAAWGLTEPGSGSDAAAMRTTAVKDGACWVLNGSKMFITHGTSADTLVIMAVTDKSKGAEGHFRVHPRARHRAGLLAGKKEDKLGMRASETTEVHPAELPRSVGAVDRRGRAGLHPDAAGARCRPHRHCGAVGRPRAGRATKRRRATPPSASSSAARSIRSRRSRSGSRSMQSQVEAARLLTYRAAWLKDQGRRMTLESAMAKLYSSEIAVRAAEDCVQMHGGYGFVKDYPAEKFFRDVKLLTIGEGTSEVQRLVIARQLLAA